VKYFPIKHPLESRSEFQNRFKMFTDSDEFPIPMIRYVQVQTHSRCNADCVFCPYSESWHAQHPGKMTEALWEKILKDLKPFAPGIIKGKFLPYLMQEPLIDPTIFNKIRDIYRYFPTTCIELSTNGIALTSKVADQLIEIFSNPHHKHHLWISFHGINKETFEHIMKLNYERAHQNVIYLLKKSVGRLKIRLRGMGSRRDGKYIFFTSQQYREYWQKNFLQYDISSENIQVDTCFFHDRAGNLHREDRNANILNMGVAREIDPSQRFYCPRIDLWLHIMWDGQIRLCCMDYHGEVILPNIHSMSLLDYFRSEAYLTLYEKVTGKRKSEENFICKRCSSPGG